MRIFFAASMIFLSLPLAAQQGLIPLLVSDHHADHLEFLLRHGAGLPAALLVVDAHADTGYNEGHSKMRAGELAGNHNWIHPLSPVPLVFLAWISTMQGAARGDKLEGFYKSTAAWSSGIRAVSISLRELPFLEIREEKLFISVDLDFFYSEDHRPEDVPGVLDALFSFSNRHQGPVAWAICLSRPWLPGDSYAWTLLEKSLAWLVSRPEFAAPEITLFESRRVDTSWNARAFRAEGRKIPALREADAPAPVMGLIQELLERRQ